MRIFKPQFSKGLAPDRIVGTFAGVGQNGAVILRNYSHSDSIRISLSGNYEMK